MNRPRVVEMKAIAMDSDMPVMSSVRAVVKSGGTRSVTILHASSKYPRELKIGILMVPRAITSMITYAHTLMMRDFLSEVIGGTNERIVTASTSSVRSLRVRRIARSD